VPCAGDIEPNDDNVKSPYPVVSPSCNASSSCTSAEVRTGAATSTDGDGLLADVPVLLVARVRFVAFDAGVRFLGDEGGSPSAAGSAPIPFFNGSLRAGRAVFDLVTSPSLSSLKLRIASLLFAGRVVVDFACAVRVADVATRVVADVIFVRFGRGIVAIDRR
jgi:hypothetical protein